MGEAGMISPTSPIRNGDGYVIPLTLGRKAGRPYIKLGIYSHG
jgi:hypothetical protein